LYPAAAGAASPPLTPRAPHPFPEVFVGGLVALGILLLVAWAVLWLVFHVASGLIHLLVIVGVVMLVWGLVKRGARAVDRKI
jgi:hypothetical protein